MRYLLSLLVALAVLSCSELWAAEKTESQEKKAVKLKATPPSQLTVVHDVQGVKELTFDLSKDKDVEAFLAKVRNGEILEIEVEKDPMHFSADLGLWAIVIFVGLLFILRKLAWGPMVEGLQKREKFIQQAIDEAKLAREETERIRAKFQADADQATVKINAMMEEGRRNAEKLSQDMLAKAAADIQAEKERGRRELQMATDQGLQELTDRTAQLATLIAANVLARTLTPDDHQRMLAIAVDEMKNAGDRFRQDIV